MGIKGHKQNVTINDRRRSNKKTSDILKKSEGRETIQRTFDMYYRDQVRALYNAVYQPK